MVPRIIRLFAVASSVDAFELRGGRIDPALDPESDKALQKDYPKDQAPEVPKGWRFDHLGGHPYPVTGSADDYDKDFVRDENGDNGEWAAQFDYDQLRSQYVKELMQAKLANGQVAEELAEWEKAKVKEAAARGAAEKNDIISNKFIAAEKEADAEVNKITGRQDGENQTVVGGSMADVVKTIEKETNDLQLCRKELATAKTHLRELMKVVADHEAAIAAKLAAEKK